MLDVSCNWLSIKGLYDGVATYSISDLKPFYKKRFVCIGTPSLGKNTLEGFFVFEINEK